MEYIFFTFFTKQETQLTYRFNRKKFDRIIFLRLLTTLSLLHNKRLYEPSSRHTRAIAEGKSVSK